MAGRRRPATKTMHALPPLECLRFFAAAARQERHCQVDKNSVESPPTASRSRLSLSTTYLAWIWGVGQQLDSVPVDATARWAAAIAFLTTEKITYRIEHSESEAVKEIRLRVEAVNRWYVHNWNTFDHKVRSSIVEGVSVFLSMFDCRHEQRMERRPALHRQPRPEHQVADILDARSTEPFSQPFAGAQNSARNGYAPRNAANASVSSRSRPASTALTANDVLSKTTRSATPPKYVNADAIPSSSELEPLERDTPWRNTRCCRAASPPDT